MSKRKILAVILGLMVFGAVFASAASLGGLTTDNLGADDAVVASCDTDGVDAAWTVKYVPGSLTYEVDEVNLSDIAAACEDGVMDVTLTGAGGAELDEVSHTLVAGDTSVDLTWPAGTAAEDVIGIHVVIDGGDVTTATP